MKTKNRVDGVVKVVAGVGGLCAAVCLLGLGWWLAVPVTVVAGLKLLDGVYQVATGRPDGDE